MVMTDNELRDRLAPLGNAKLSDEQFSRIRRNIQYGIRASRNKHKPSRIWGMGEVGAEVILPLILLATGIYSVNKENAAHKQQHHPLSPSPSPSVPLTGVHMYGKEDGWMIGANQQLLRTTDGGRHWVNVTPPEGVNVISQIVTVTGPKVASVAVGTLRGQKAFTTIYHTVDGGSKWSKTVLQPAKVNEKTGLLPSSMMFADGQHGWLNVQIPNYGMGGSVPGPLYRTNNGGATWSLVSQAVGKNIVSFRWVYFLNAKDGFTEGAQQAVGADAGDTGISPEKLYVSHDGGSHWTLAKIRLPQGNSVHVLQPTFVANGQGVLPVVQTNSAQSDSVYLYTTADSGAKWIASGKLVVNQPRDNVLVDVLDAKHWWIYWNGQLYNTSNAGRSFASTSVAISNVADLDFIDGKTGFAIVNQIREYGETGVLYKTTDGGKTWTRN